MPRRRRLFGPEHLTFLVVLAILVGIIGAGKGCSGENTEPCTPGVDCPMQTDRQK